MEREAECASRTTRVWNTLLEDLCSSGCLANSHNLHDPFINTRLGKSSTRFCHGIPQAPAEKSLYMRLPQGYHRKGITNDIHVLNLIRNMYGQKQAGRVWNKYLDEGMKEVGFALSEYDPYLYYKKNVVMLAYIDHCLVFSPDPKLINRTISDLRNSSKNFDIDDQGDVSEVLGVDVTHLKDGSIKLTQPHLIDMIVKDLHLQENTKEKSTPALSSQILYPDVDGKDMGDEFHCRSVIGMLNFLEKSTRIDITVFINVLDFLRIPRSPMHQQLRILGAILRQPETKG